MFGKKILFLAAGYVAGNVVASVYSSKKKRVKKVQGKEDIKLIVEGFLDTQKNFLADMEKKYLPEEHKEKFAEKKADFKKFSEKYIKQGEQLLAEVQKNENMIEGKNKAKKLLTQLSEKGKKTIVKVGEKLKKEKDEF